MISTNRLSHSASGRDDWQSILSDSIGDPAELCRLLGLAPAVAAAAELAARKFPMRVPRTYLARIRPGEPNDPLLAQVLPRGEELADLPRFVADPLGEASAACAPGLLRKYQRRILILSGGTCGVHCRFCFRRHFSPPKVGGNGLSDQILSQISSDESIEEVILSGGDPLATPDPQLAQIIAQLAAIGHVRRLRIHTRLPIIIPQRVTDGLVACLRGTRLTPIVVVHANHPAEIDADVADALGRLIDAGIPVLNQAVLLRGVNDDVDVLTGLFSRLADLRVMPYYLHQLDCVAGAGHFEVPEARGIELIDQLRARLPGYAVPRYVRDVPGSASKQVLA